MSVINTKTPRKIFEVIIHGKPFDVYDINGKEHEGLNGEPKTWWVYFTDRLPEGTLPPPDSDKWEPYHKSINRRLWDIRFKEYNTSKEKWGSTQFRSGLNCEMYCNDKLIYSFGTNDLAFAMAKAQYLIIKMSEHPYDFFNPKSELGRKIWWYGLPATVKPKSDGWEIAVVPDYSTGIDKKIWWSEFKKRRSNLNEKVDENDIQVWDGEDDYSDYINWGDALSDGHIDWFRK
jgi:hypothetical protein